MRQFTRRDALRLGATVAAGTVAVRGWIGNGEAATAAQVVITPPLPTVQPGSTEIFDANNRIRFIAPPTLTIPDAVQTSEPGEFGITALSFSTGATGASRFLTIRRTTAAFPGAISEADWWAAKEARFGAGSVHTPLSGPEARAAGGFAGFVGLVDAETAGGNPYREAIWTGGRETARVTLSLIAAQLRVRGVRAAHDGGAADLAQILDTLDLDAR